MAARAVKRREALNCETAEAKQKPTQLQNSKESNGRAAMARAADVTLLISPHLYYNTYCVLELRYMLWNGFIPLSPFI